MRLLRQHAADLIIFTDEILYGKLHFLYSDGYSLHCLTDGHDHHISLKLIFILGANIFLEPSYSTNIFVMKDTSKKRKFSITVGANKMSAHKFSINTKLSIEVRLYKFNTTKAFEAIKDNILLLISKEVRPKEPNANVTEQKYQIKVTIFVNQL